MKKLLGALSVGLVVAVVAALVITNPFAAGGDFTEQTKLLAELTDDVRPAGLGAGTDARLEPGEGVIEITDGEARRRRGSVEL